MIPAYLISNYIDRLTIEDAYRLSKKYKTGFTYEEIQLLLLFAKKHKNEFQKKNVDMLLEQLKKDVDATTFSKIMLLKEKYSH